MNTEELRSIEFNLDEESGPGVPLLTSLLMTKKRQDAGWVIRVSDFGPHFGFSFGNGFVGFHFHVAPLGGRYIMTVFFTDIEDRHSYCKSQRVNNKDVAFRQAIAHILKTQRDEGL